MLRSIADGLIAVILAPVCAACRGPLDTPTRSPVCDRCWTAIRLPTPPFCGVCGDPLASWRTAGDSTGRCPQCRHRRSITKSRAIGDCDGVLRDILHALKYDGRRSVAPQLAALLRVHGQSVLSGADCAVPVPLHWSRRWRRGFNQAADLATCLGLPVLHALRRRRPTPSQTNLPVAARHRNVRGAFVSRRRVRIAGLVVVLVDDVRTTGATLDACAKALIEAGAKEVRALTAARVSTTPGPAPRR